MSAEKVSEDGREPDPPINVSLGHVTSQRYEELLEQFQQQQEAFSASYQSGDREAAIKAAKATLEAGRQMLDTLEEVFRPSTNS